MPGVSGIEAARILGGCPEALIIMLTSFDDEELLRRARPQAPSGTCSKTYGLFS